MVVGGEMLVVAMVVECAGAAAGVSGSKNSASSGTHTLGYLCFKV